MNEKTILTGITTTGTPHLGNYVGAIKPAIAASHAEGVSAYYFLADYHALVTCHDPEVVRQSTLEIAATWLALGLDTDRSTFYRQSDIPEISELTWLLTCHSAAHTPTKRRCRAISTLARTPISPSPWACSVTRS